MIRVLVDADDIGIVSPCSPASRRFAPAGACGGLDTGCARRLHAFVVGVDPQV